MNNKILASIVVVGLCAVAFVGVGYAYNATIDTGTSNITADYVTIALDANGTPVDASEDLNVKLVVKTEIDLSNGNQPTYKTDGIATILNKLGATINGTTGTKATDFNGFMEYKITIDGLNGVTCNITGLSKDNTNALESVTCTGSQEIVGYVTIQNPFHALAID